MITAASNNRIKTLVQLNQKAKVRKEQEVFLAEGVKMFLEAPRERIREIYISESFSIKEEVGTSNGEVGLKLRQVGYEVVSDTVFSKVSDTITPQGILCVVKQNHYNLEQVLAFEKKQGKEPFYILLEDLQDPGNLGTIFRTGEGAGISGVIMTKGTVDIYNPKTIRATMGSVYRIPFFYVEDIKQTMERLKNEKVTIYAAHLKGEKTYDELCFEEGTAFLIGNEGNGLKKETADYADRNMLIPMEGKVESLNASMAAGILMYETQRQRRNKVT